jgi:hypothetical protein
MSRRVRPVLATRDSAGLPFTNGAALVENATNSKRKPAGFHRFPHTDGPRLVGRSAAFVELLKLFSKSRCIDYDVI